MQESKSSVSSVKSWTNEEFARLYEPISVKNLKKKNQLKQIDRHLKSRVPILDQKVHELLRSRIIFTAPAPGKYFGVVPVPAAPGPATALAFTLICSKATFLIRNKS
jgi:hypothetical protein